MCVFPCVIVEPAATMNGSARVKKARACELMVVIVCRVARRPCNTAAEGRRAVFGLRLTGWAKKRLDELVPDTHEAILHVTLTDDHPWAQAFVVIEARLKT